eukprot:COSAG03_NODE_5969_length_1139_cov_1.708654_1_plen_48_part_10
MKTCKSAKNDRPEWAGSRPAVGARSDREGGLLGEEEYRFWTSFARSV